MLQAQGKQKQALEVVEGTMGDVISMAAERRSLRACLHVCSWHLYLLPPSVILPCTPDACAVEAKAPVSKANMDTAEVHFVFNFAYASVINR